MIDVGASNGCMSKNKKRETIVYAFECNRKHLKELNKLASETYHVIPKAVDEVNREAMYYEASYMNSSSLLPFTESVSLWKCPPKMQQTLKCVDSYIVECIRLDTYLDSIDFRGDIDFIKIDTQGNDLKVIKSLGKYLSCVKLLQAEVQVTPYELYKGATNRDELIQYMMDQGFRIESVRKWSMEQEEEITFAK